MLAVAVSYFCICFCCVGRYHSGWGDMTLYFGCRRSDLDWIYKDETQKACSDGVLASNRCALSREPGQTKVRSNSSNCASEVTFFADF